MNFDPNEHPHMRHNPLKDDWIIVSPHRTMRPWCGQAETENATDATTPAHDASNPLCPGVKRSSGRVTPHYRSTYVFANDFPALLPDLPDKDDAEDDELFRSRPARGVCKVICFHPRSDVYLHDMRDDEVANVIDAWFAQTADLGKRYDWVQIFENRGAMMGCSNRHPHCQVWASEFLPNEARVKDANMRKYHARHGRPLLMDYLNKELAKRERIVYENDEWVVLVPYWAVWPFETMVLPRRQTARFTDMDGAQRRRLIDALRTLIVKYDNLFACTFPYSMGWHGAPTGQFVATPQPHWTLHCMYFPPLLRSATVRKFMVGYELLAQAQRDLTPEKAAKMLREQDVVHYKRKSK